MKALIQRVRQAGVEVDGKSVGKIGEGILLFLGVDQKDDKAAAEKLASRCINYRIFSDDAGKMNLSLIDKTAELLVISQFTLSADTQKGRRPSFTTAASPDLAQELYEYFVQCCQAKIDKVETGEFAADMQVSLTNDGPVTFLLES